MTLSQDGMPPTHQTLENIVTQLVISALGKKLASIGPDAPLFSSQSGFDSFFLLELVLRLEDTFGLSIPDEDLDPVIFYSVRSIAAYVRTRLVGGE
jgi:acyl carrier protein